MHQGYGRAKRLRPGPAQTCGPPAQLRGSGPTYPGSAMTQAANGDLVSDIEDTIRGHVIAKMPPDSTGDLSSMPLRQLLGVYWTWRERFPEPRPRTVHRSREL